MSCFGGIIYALRKSRYFTQEQLAEQLGVSAVTISKWERNETMPSLELLCKLADADDAVLRTVIREAQRLVLELVR